MASWNSADSMAIAETPANAPVIPQTVCNALWALARALTVVVSDCGSFNTHPPQIALSPLLVFGHWRSRPSGLRFFSLRLL